MTGFNKLSLSIYSGVYEVFLIHGRINVDFVYKFECKDKVVCHI